MFMRSFAMAGAALVALAGPALAASQAEADALMDAFVGAKGFEAVALEALYENGSDYQALFRHAPTSASAADASLGPVEKALLIAETLETEKPDRVRYAISYARADGEDAPFELVEIRRYNLGPLIHRATMEEYGAENVAAAEDFGVGPDVAWRFAFTPEMGTLALPVAASRREIAAGAPQLDEDDQTEVCLSGPCRSLSHHADGIDQQDASDKAEPFAPLNMPAMGEPAYDQQARHGNGGYVPAAVARLLGGMLGLADDAGWRAPETPEGAAPGEPTLLMQIDRNLGQEIMSFGFAGQTHLMDDDIAEIWVKGGFVSELPTIEPMRQIVRRR